MWYRNVNHEKIDMEKKAVVTYSKNSSQEVKPLVHLLRLPV